MYNHIMIDLETVDTAPTSGIIQIGAVSFNPKHNEIIDTFDCIVNLKSCTDVGLTWSRDTLEWWISQTSEAKRIITEANSGGKPIKVALLEFNKWFVKNNGFYVWGNGSDFDQPIMNNAYNRVGVDIPWNFRNNRCYRTMNTIFPEKFERHGVNHNALDDAKTQAVHLMKIINTYGLGKAFP